MVKKKKYKNNYECNIFDQIQNNKCFVYVHSHVSKILHRPSCMLWHRAWRSPKYISWMDISFSHSIVFYVSQLFSDGVHFSRVAVKYCVTSNVIDAGNSHFPGIFYYSRVHLVFHMPEIRNENSESSVKHRSTYIKTPLRTNFGSIIWYEEPHRRQRNV